MHRLFQAGKNYRVRKPTIEEFQKGVRLEMNFTYTDVFFKLIKRDIPDVYAGTIFCLYWCVNCAFRERRVWNYGRQICKIEYASAHTCKE